MKNQTFSLLQVSFILFLFIGMLNHVLVIPLLLDVSGRDSWLSAIMAFLILIPFFLLVAFISKLTKQQPIMSHIALRYGRWVSRSACCSRSWRTVLAKSGGESPMRVRD
ncbi:hypothetical protein [Cohnella herbarum]|uniref:Spore germination protein n=1 Tax=Cohnella herbarum TaxID=2728023 RepID=A0A7Z2ZJV8_9BACL|nr:hypothetical protein [Cohnella herbarum]QJD82566.1 hypothetical protein HH215_04740 [Cohnella herbarum]